MLVIVGMKVVGVNRLFHFNGAFMQNRKIFKTYDEQILILKSRGIIIDDETEAKNFFRIKQLL